MYTRAVCESSFQRFVKTNIIHVYKSYPRASLKIVHLFEIYYLWTLRWLFYMTGNMQVTVARHLIISMTDGVISWKYFYRKIILSATCTCIVLWHGHRSVLPASIISIKNTFPIINHIEMLDKCLHVLKTEWNRDQRLTK